jgi:hypothetical protein
VSRPRRAGSTWPVSKTSALLASQLRLGRSHALRAGLLGMTRSSRRRAKTWRMIFHHDQAQTDVHPPIASRSLVTPWSRRPTLMTSAASLALIRSSSRSRRSLSFSTSRRRSSLSCAWTARMKQRWASMARSSSNVRAIAEKDLPSSRSASACASSSGALSRCLRVDPPRSGLGTDRLFAFGLCVCLGTGQPLRVSLLKDVPGSVRIGPTREFTNGPYRLNADNAHSLPVRREQWSMVLKPHLSIRFRAVRPRCPPARTVRRSSARGGMTQL